jgi:hypothetical protein
VRRGMPIMKPKIESDLTATDSIVEAREDLKKTFATLGEYNIVESAYFEL